jgi:dolichol-phosphate mannosyltransferase
VNARTNGEWPDVSIVIPCFNEAPNVTVLTDELLPVVAEMRRERSVEVVFVDDGSGDGTPDMLESIAAGDPAARVIRHARNRGLGAALRTGFQHARGSVIVSTDSDATYPFALIPRLLDLLDPAADVVTASCYHPDGGVSNVPGYRLLFSRSASLIYRALVGRGIHTYTCMFRAYRRPVLEEVPFTSDGFLAVTELLVGAMREGYVVRELPCTLRVRRYGVSKAKLLRTILSHLRFQAGLVFSAKPPAHDRRTNWGAVR